ncbi:MAG TPA: N-methyl-L-tryptophan oxidase [Candidatus Limnocylindria bacterium]|nr:N-methyl-L-tryptophan oxidase [Candidatus Limnocylindria bacterium]
MSERYDAIVIGLGGMGSAAAFHLARRGQRVLGLEQFELGHERGSSHGLTRIIRLAYHEDPSYVPLLRRSYELWHELERAAGERLLITTGSIEGGPEDGPMFTGALEAARLHGLEHEVLDAPEIARRYPTWANLAADTRVVLQPDGGFLLSEAAVRAHAEAATAHGAELHFEERVTAWEALADGGAGVTTTTAAYEAERLVICAGPWARQLVPRLGELAVPERQVLGWFTPMRNQAAFSVERFPVFILDVESGSWYGFPAHDGHGVKLGWYHHFREPIDPDDSDRSANARDEQALRGFMERHLPDAAGPTEMLKACIFTNAPDEHFIVDRLPDAPQVTLVSACSGHGFKFCSVIGEICADLAIDGATRHDIGLFRLDRFDA